MVCEFYKASVPGSLMLMGEHAVLHGYSALVFAIDKRITATLWPRKDNEIHLNSDLGTFITNLNDIKILPPFQFVLTAVRSYLKDLSCGFKLCIESAISSHLGLGSSAAVTVATLSVLSQWLQQELTMLTLIAKAKEVIQTVQGLGSGSDVAASVLGGIVTYRMQPFIAEKIADTLPVVVVYSGSKKPTREVVSLIERDREKNPKKFNKLYQSIDQCTQKAVSAIKETHWKMLGELMNEHYCYQDEIGMSTPILADIIGHLRRQEGIYGAKISGSGLGDCVIGLGHLPKNYFPVDEKQQNLGVIQLLIKVTSLGYCIAS